MSGCLFFLRSLPPEFGVDIGFCGSSCATASSAMDFTEPAITGAARKRAPSSTLVTRYPLIDIEPLALSIATPTCLVPTIAVWTKTDVLPLAIRANKVLVPIILFVVLRNRRATLWTRDRSITDFSSAVWTRD